MGVWVRVWHRNICNNFLLNLGQHEAFPITVHLRVFNWRGLGVSRGHSACNLPLSYAPSLLSWDFALGCFQKSSLCPISLSEFYSFAFLFLLPKQILWKSPKWIFLEILQCGDIFRVYRRYKPESNVCLTVLLLICDLAMSLCN